MPEDDHRYSHEQRRRFWRQHVEGYLFSHLPLAHSPKELRARLPNRVKQATIEAFEKQPVKLTHTNQIIN
jgi:hypothetical protein